MDYKIINTYTIPNGTLVLKTNEDPSPYLKVEARNNPKRGFLFVSKILGKHLPVQLSDMRESYINLVSKLPSMEGDTLVIGMAETATMLGYGVWREINKNKDINSFFLQTTRYKTCENAKPFEESHSHAPSQWIQGLDSEKLKHVKNVVLVDDEISTGNTFHNLAKVVRENIPSVNTFHWVCLTDFRPEKYRDHPSIALIDGEWDFTWSVNLGNNQASSQNNSIGFEKVPFDFGRKIPLDNRRRINIIERAIENMKEEMSYRGIGKKVLVLGSGEFMPFAFEMAEFLEEQNIVVDFQATTRSPALMERVELGVDHYGEGVQQYIYNYNRSEYDSVFTFIECDNENKTEEISQTLNSHVINVKNW